MEEFKEEGDFTKNESHEQMVKDISKNIPLNLGDVMAFKATISTKETPVK